MKKRKYPHIKIKKNSVLKKFEGNVESEHHKYMMFNKVCNKIGAVSPEIISLDINKSEILFSKIKFDFSLRQNYIDTLLGKIDLSDAVELHYKVGETLGLIHKKLELKEVHAWQPSKDFTNSVNEVSNDLDELLSNTPNAFLHGDYGFANLAFTNENNRIVIFDPSPNEYSTFHPCDYGSIYIDIGIYYSNINGRIPLVYYPFVDWGIISKFKESFNNGYMISSGNKISIEIAERIGFASSKSCYIRHFGNGLQTKVRMNLLYNKIKGNVL